MPGPDHTSIRKTRPGALLSAAALVWLSVVVMPCAALAASPVAEQAQLVEQIETNCHGAHAEADTPSPDCCCDPLVVTGGEAPTAQRVNVVAAAPPADFDVAVTQIIQSIDRVYVPPWADAGVPVYLATRRLRI